MYEEDTKIAQPGVQDILNAIHVIVDAGRVIGTDAITIDYAIRPYLVRWADDAGAHAEGWNSFAAMTGDPHKSPPTEYRLMAMQSQFNILQRELDRGRDSTQMVETLDIELRKARQTIYEQKMTICQQEDKIDNHEVVISDLQEANKTVRNSAESYRKDLTAAKRTVADQLETITLLHLELEDIRSKSN